MHYRILDTPWGAFGIVCRGQRLLATHLPAPRSYLTRRIKRDWPAAVETDDLLPGFARQVVDYFDGATPRFRVDLDLSDHTPFRQTVFEQCRRIPYGQTASYADLARAAGRPGAARAVGSTMANNPLPLVVPCHRVLRSDGTIGGFSSPEGVRQKERLLRLEDALPHARRAAAARAGVRGRSRTRNILSHAAAQ